MSGDELVEASDPDTDTEAVAVRVADVKSRRDPMMEAAAEAERELAAAVIGHASPETLEALEAALADNEEFAALRRAGDDDA